MPELPEVETIRRTLEPLLVGRRVTRVRLARPDIVSGDRSPGSLLQGCEITSLERHGKQLAIIARPAATASTRRRAPSVEQAIVVQLGMSGQFYAAPQRDTGDSASHVHAVWHLSRAGEQTDARLVFRDPRRFGGITPFADRRALDADWARLGPDALSLRASSDPRLESLWRTSRMIKTALLDQSRIAGIGNIYADEGLYRAGVHPMRPAASLGASERARLVHAIVSVLEDSLRHGGTTLRDYRNGQGEPGSFQTIRSVYGRRGAPCSSCGTILMGIHLAARATTWCPKCQDPGLRQNPVPRLFHTSPSPANAPGRQTPRRKT